MSKTYTLTRLTGSGTSSDVGTIDLKFTLDNEYDLDKAWSDFLSGLPEATNASSSDESCDGPDVVGDDFEETDEFSPDEIEQIVRGLETASMMETYITDISEDETPDGHLSEDADVDEQEDYTKDMAPLAPQVSMLIPNNGNLLNVPTVQRKKKKLRRRRKVVPRGYYEFNSRSHVVGLLYMEVERATDLPPMRNMTKTGFDMDPFVVVSFGKKTFRTPWRRHTLNPVFNEKLMFPVLQHEKAYSINFTVMDKDRITLNDFVASVDVEVQKILKTAPVPDKNTLLYDLDTMFKINPVTISEDSAEDLERSLKGSPRKFSRNRKTTEDQKHLAALTDESMVSFELPLQLKKAKYEDKHSPKLFIKAKFLPYTALRQQFWRGLIQLFSDEEDSIGFYEISQLLETLGSNLSEKTIIGFFTRFGKQVEDELTTEEVIMCLEDQILKDTINQQKNPHGMNASKDTNPSIPPGTDFITGLDDENDPSQERMIQLSACPFCNQPRLKKRAEIDIVTHLATCANQDWAVDGQLVMDKFVSSNHARKRWYSKVVSKVTYGNYGLGANSANILVQDRITGYIQEEKMNMYIRLGIRVLYKGIRSSRNMESKRARNMLKSLSIKQGRKYDDPASTKVIPSFIKFHALNMSEVLEPVENFKTFNEFFYRKLKPGARPCEAPHEERILVSPADCRSTYFPTISKATDIWIKGRDFSLARLFGNAYPQYVDRFVNGSLAIFRLAPQDYHRFHVPVSGILEEPKTIEGEYYTVNPMAIRSSLDVFGENVRVLVPIQSDEFGLVMVVCVGAMMVGSTVITAKAGQRVSRTDELGYFQFGGSTLVVLFEPGRLKFDNDLVQNSASALETLVRVGMSIGHAPSISEYERHDDVNPEDVKRAKEIISGEANDSGN